MQLSELSQIILHIINDHSGGMKFSELLTEILSHYYEHNMKVPETFNEIILNTIEKELKGKLKILWYRFQNKTKLFIYTPEEEK